MVKIIEIQTKPIPEISIWSQNFLDICKDYVKIYRHDI